MTRPLAAFAAFSLALAVVLGAVGAHAVGDDPDARELWRTASFWHTADSLGLLALAALFSTMSSRLAVAGTVSILLGAVAFCGSLYAQAVFGAAPIPMLAPAGGTLQIVGWLLIALAFLRGPSRA